MNDRYRVVGYDTRRLAKAIYRYLVAYSNSLSLAVSVISSLHLHDEFIP